MTQQSALPAGIHQVLERALCDPEFKKELLTDRRRAIITHELELSDEEWSVLDAISDSDLQTSIQALEKQLEKVPERSRKKLVMGALGRVALYGGVIGLLASIAVPSYGHDVKRGRLKACLANMQVLEGAIDMWEMDSEGMTIESGVIVDGEHHPGPVGEKIRGDYVKKLPRCREGGVYQYDAETDTVTCSVHGTVDNHR